MSDTNLASVRPKHSRSTSITTSKKTTSHQRKPSFTQQQLPVSSSISSSEKRHSTGAGAATHNRPTLSSSHGSASGNKLSTNSHHGHTTTGPRFLNSIMLRVHSFLNPSGPLLPHVKHGAAAFGGTTKPSFFRSLLQSRVVRFFALFYVVFSVFLSLNHTWKYMTSPKAAAVLEGDNSASDSVVSDKRFGPQWKPQRTYDQGKKRLEVVVSMEILTK